jgi:hypothetical protein
MNVNRKIIPTFKNHSFALPSTELNTYSRIPSSDSPANGLLWLCPELRQTT